MGAVDESPAGTGLLTVVAVLQRIVDNGAECAGVHEVAHVVVVAQALHIVHIERQRAVDELVESTGRQDPLAGIRAMAQVAASQVIVAAIGHLDGDGRRCLDIGGHLDALQLLAIDFLELRDIARGLGRTQLLGAGVIDKGHLGGTVEQTVEIEGHNRLLLLDGRHAMGAPDIVGNERVDAAAAREYALVHRQDQQVLEIEAARLEQTHNLQAVQGLSRERDNCRRRQTVNQEKYSAGFQGLAACCQGLLELIEHIDIHDQEGLLQRQFHAIASVVPIIFGHLICPLFGSCRHVLHQQVAEGQQAVQILRPRLPHSRRVLAVHGGREQVVERQVLKLGSRHPEAVGTG